MMKQAAIFYYMKYGHDSPEPDIEQAQNLTDSTPKTSETTDNVFDEPQYDSKIYSEQHHLKPESRNVKSKRSRLSRTSTSQGEEENTTSLFHKKSVKNDHFKAEKRNRFSSLSKRQNKETRKSSTSGQTYSEEFENQRKTSSSNKDQDFIEGKNEDQRDSTISYKTVVENNQTTEGFKEQTVRQRKISVRLPSGFDQKELTESVLVPAEGATEMDDTNQTDQDQVVTLPGGQEVIFRKGRLTDGRFAFLSH